MKISKTFLETILPITIGTLLFIAYFFITEKLESQSNLESCERYELSTAVWLIFAFIIIVISSLYQIIIGNWILKRNWNKFALNIVNSLIFGVIFTLIYILTEVLNEHSIDVKFSTGLFLAIFVLGLLFSALKSVAEKYLNKV